jgi:hypothetical protein
MFAAARKQINRFAPNIVCLFLETKKRIQGCQNSGNVFRVRFTARAVPVAGKLSKMEVKRKEQRSFVGEGITATKTTTLKYCPGIES